MGKNVTRLYSQFQPSHYAIELWPDREKSTFHGTVSIKGKKVGRPSQRLTFHQIGLKISAVEVIKHDKKGDTPIIIDRINTHENFNEARLHATEMVYPGEYTVKMKFEGKITQPMNGMYPCFFEEDGVQKQLIATQFESHDARKVFPGIDEPEAKATFDLIMNTPAGEPVIANTPIKDQQTKGKIVRTVFETTPKMSTYLLAFVYGDMKYKEAKTKDGVVVRTYATPSNVDFTDFALEIGVKILDFYNEYFDIPYPLAKCDMIALPDFASGAMENWGCITYREQALLVDPVNTSLPTKQHVAMVVAHELAHQWFGNLVTMRWWTDLWLNEGFASWIEYLAVDHLFPEWNMWTQFNVDEQHRGLKLDALENTHPVEVPIAHPDQIRTIFDGISYSKGASVIHMLHEYLGAEMFRDGLRHYLNRHKYGNTDTVDLWQALEEISGKPVKDFMHAWIAQPGFPLVTANITDGKVELHQERFLLNANNTNPSKLKWPIALLARNSDIPELMTKRSETLVLDGISELKLNRGQSGFFRTTYNSEHLERLGEDVRNDRMDTTDRLGLLSDVFEASKIGKTSTVDALKFMTYYADEADSAVWDVIAGGIGSIRTVMDDEALREDMKPYIRGLVAKELARLGWEPKLGEAHFDQLLRPTILGMASASDEPSVVKKSLELFESMKKSEDIAPDLRGVVYGTAVRNGDRKVFDKLFAIHESSNNSEERITIAAALTNFKQPELVELALSKIDTDSVRSQDVAYWVIYSFMNRYARDATWKWMITHWDWLIKVLDGDLAFYQFPLYAARVYSSQEFLKEFRAFFDKQDSPLFERSIKQGIEVLEWQSAWKDRDLSAIKAYFKNQK